MPKPQKPWPKYPLTPHKNGQFCKKINGKIWYFGSDSDAALARYEAEVADIKAGRDPRQSQRHSGLTIADICHRFIDWKKSEVASGDLSSRTLDDYERAVSALLKHYGDDRSVTSITPSDWGQFAAENVTGAASTRTRLVTTIKTIFKFADEMELIPHPMRFGPMFRAAKQKARRAEKQAKGDLSLSADEINTLISRANDQWKAMIYLGINCGYGNADISQLTWNRFDGQWVEYPRPKTLADRRAWLWPETRKAIAAHRKQAESTDGLVFVTKYGNPYGQYAITGPFAKMLKTIDAKRPDVNFYSLRRTFQTVADGLEKPLATKAVMGHLDTSMSGEYRQYVSDANIRAVCQHVRRWLLKK